MSLLSIVKTVMDSNGWPAPPGSVASSQDENMRQAFSLANKALTSASYKKDWPVLIREWKFHTIAGQSEYDLPPDFHHLVAPSAVNSDQYYQLKGSLPSLQWFRALYGGRLSWGDAFRVYPFTKKFRLSPTPSGPNRVVFMYVTTDIAKNSSGTPVSRFTQDTDTPLIDEDVVELGLTWRWRQKKGMDYTAEMAEYGGTLRERFAQQMALGELPVGGHNYDSMYPLTDGRVEGPLGV